MPCVRDAIKVDRPRLPEDFDPNAEWCRDLPDHPEVQLPQVATLKARHEGAGHVCPIGEILLAPPPFDTGQPYEPSECKVIHCRPPRRGW
jgi:hypothetical protein